MLQFDSVLGSSVGKVVCEGMLVALRVNDVGYLAL